MNITTIPLQEKRMRSKLITTILVLALSGHSALAQEHQHMTQQKSMTSVNGDMRQAVDFPAEMRQHTLSNMRDHLQALDDILQALANGRYAQAGRVADARLGLDSPSAEGCKDDGRTSKPSDMAHRMADFMPEEMRKIGAAMHASASTFALEANKAAKSRNGKAALAALSRVTQQCTACHAAYKLQ